MINCATCLSPFHRNCLASLETKRPLDYFFCPSCQILKFNENNNWKVIHFFQKPKLILRPGEICSKFEFNIEMAYLKSIKCPNTFLMLSCQRLNPDRIDFKWPHYTNIFLNDKRLSWEKLEYNSKAQAKPFFFYFNEDDQQISSNNHLNYFCDYFFIDYTNKLEIKKTFEVDDDSCYVISLYLVSETEQKEYHFVNECICQEKKEEVIYLEDDNDDFVMESNDCEVIDLSDDVEDPNQTLKAPQRAEAEAMVENNGDDDDDSNKEDDFIMDTM